MIELLVENPLLLLMVVTAIGYAIGRITIKGSSLGVAAVLFVGLAVGAVDPRLALPEAIYLLGLVTFVYTVGLSSGPGFLPPGTPRGRRDTLFIRALLGGAGGRAAGANLVLGMAPTVAAGIFAGSLTNTPALAGVLDALRTQGAADAVLSEPVVGYSVAYPMGVLGMILVVSLCQRWWRVDYTRENERLRGFNLVEQHIYNRTVRVTNPAVVGVAMQKLALAQAWGVVLTRVKREDATFLVDGDTQLAQGDLVNVLGAPDRVNEATAAMGEPTDEHLEFDRTHYDYRRVFVSNPAVVGRKLSELRLPERYRAIVTRVREGDIVLLADGHRVLEVGDLVREGAPRTRLAELSTLFGDSYKGLSEINLVSLGLGLSLGLLIGLIPIRLPGGITLTLGYAGGPLLVALVLGALRRTGPVVWTLSYTANLTLRQVGLIMLLAGIGVRSGYTFVSTFAQSGGVLIFLAGAVITLTTGFLTLWVGYKLLKIPFPLLTGMLSALQTQPAVLGHALEQAKTEVPNIGYALVFPIATITKIVVAQALYLLLR